MPDTLKDLLDEEASLPVCPCGCPRTDHMLAAYDTDSHTALWLCIGCLHACPGLPRQPRGPDDELQGDTDA